MIKTLKNTVVDLSKVHAINWDTNGTHYFVKIYLAGGVLDVGKFDKKDRDILVKEWKNS